MSNSLNLKHLAVSDFYNCASKKHPAAVVTGRLAHPPPRKLNCCGGVFVCDCVRGDVLLHFDLFRDAQQQNNCTKAAEGVISFGNLSTTLINMADKSVSRTSL